MNGILSIAVKPRTDNLVDIAANPKAIFDLKHNQRVTFRGVVLTTKHEEPTYGDDIYFVAAGSRVEEFGREFRPQGAIDSMYLVRDALEIYSDYIKHLRVPSFAVTDEHNICELLETQSRAIGSRSMFVKHIGHCFIG